MKSISHLFSALALAAVSATASAAPAIYSTSAAFLGQLMPGAYTENFDGLDQAPSPDFSNGVYSYSFSSPQGIYGSGEFVSASQEDDALTINFTSGNVKAIGANFFATDLSDDFQSVSISLLLSDGTTESFTPTMQSDSYRGFISDAFITSLVISGPGTSLYASLDNLTVGTVGTRGALPEPASAALVGLALAGLAVARRRHGA
ncbi:PEP-CTERM sorting domain-containing protein [Roseateles sp. P5_E7]